MVGEVEPNVRELMLLLILAFAQKDARFLAEVVLLLGAGRRAQVRPRISRRFAPTGRRS
jgi:predicted unusual protein kinase regulating ubiquinone biosynthesis (AarF/ABC1/UbiB family)